MGAVNMDLIAGLPADTPAGFRRTVEEVLAMAPENITVHTLALKKGARLRQEETPLPSGTDVAAMLDFAWAALRQAGYLPYYLYRQKFMSWAREASPSWWRAAWSAGWPTPNIPRSTCGTWAPFRRKRPPFPGKTPSNRQLFFLFSTFCDFVP